MRNDFQIHLRALFVLFCCYFVIFSIMRCSILSLYNLFVLITLFLKNPVASSKLVTDTVENPAWSLNLHHETWCNPWDKSIASKSSFPDLFRQSLGKLSTIFYMINSMLDTGQPLKLSALENLLSELGNYSYHSGLPCADD